ncbi:MAG: hypothetical protein ACLSBL_01510 [Ezakiella massiliensis]
MNEEMLNENEILKANNALNKSGQVEEQRRLETTCKGSSSLSLTNLETS